MKSVYKIFVVSILFISSLNAQELSVGADLVSRYIWRGIESGGSAPSLQPTLKFSAGGFAAGFWGAYSFSNPDALEEIDIFAGYTVDLNSSGALSLGFTDYTFPNNGTKIGNFNNYDDPDGPGAHYVELNAGYAGPESFPISLSFNMFVYNLEHNPIYFQVGYAATINDIGFGAFVGGTPGDDNGYYGVTEFSLINVGISAAKTIKLSDDFSFPLFGQVILNPASEDLFYVVGISL